MKKKILFDCDCRLCTASIRFVKRHDEKGLYSFVPLQSGAAKKLLSGHGIGDEADSAVLIDGEKALTKSDAVLAIVEELDGLWRHLAVFRFLPKGLRDGCYDLVAKYRYRLFGRKRSCDPPET
jgi:predicted DCC family thiol-disulfide oxidoreductase YuxK